MQKIIELLQNAAGASCVMEQESMKKHTTFRIGGPADVFVVPDTVGKAAEAVRICKEQGVPYYILGNGSNLLVSDEGYRGVVIQIYKNLSAIEIGEDVICAQAGAMLSAIAKRALAASLTGLEFASGIPGTLGGACVMNAGAYGGEMKDVLSEVTVLDENGNMKVLPAGELELGYRSSALSKNGWTALSAKLQLAHGDYETIAARMEELKEKRTTKQPLDMPSAGSTFKRPEGYFAGKLIMDAGLRGFSVGGAQVSEKHCGFVVNTGEATAADVRELIAEVVRRVKENSGVTLEPEVKMLGEFEI